MRVYRLCGVDEFISIIGQKNGHGMGYKYKIDPKKNTHQYKENVNYMHFHNTELGLLYLHPINGLLVCVYNIPDEILNYSKGKGFYLDFIFLKDIHEITEYAIESDKVKLEYLETIYEVERDLDFDYVPDKSEIYENLRLVCSFNRNNK